MPGAKADRVARGHYGIDRTGRCDADADIVAASAPLRMIVGIVVLS